MEKFHRSPIHDYMAVARYAGEKDFQVAQPDSLELKKVFEPIERRLWNAQRKRDRRNSAQNGQDKAGG